MIVDRLENWQQYPLGPAWRKTFEFLLSVSPEIADGEYPLQEEDLFARVMTYRTRRPEEAMLETHREYVDVQTVLRGGEGMEWFPRQGLTVTTPYDSGKDAEFYARPAAGPARVDVRPGLFAMFLPEDAHMPSLQIEAPEEIRKVVVKIRLDLLRQRSSGA